MKAWLSRAAVPFEALDVMTDDDAYDALMHLGFRRVPVTVVGSEVIQGYDPEALARLTRDWREVGQTAAPADAPSE